MVKQNINVLIDACIEQMRADRYDETCIEVHRRRWQKGIVSYLNAQGTSEYTEQAGLDFLSRILPGLAPSTQRGHQRGINLLTEFMHTGVVRRRIVTLVEHPLPGELGTIVLKYLEELKAQRRADQTISNHRRLLSYFLEGLRRKGISQLADLTESAIIEFVDHAHTCKREHFYSIRQFCRFLSKEGFVDRDLGYALQSNNFPNHEKLPSVYTAEEILKIENTIERSSQVGKRDYAIFIIASRLGLRVSDIAALKWSQIDWDNGTICLYQSKTKAPVELPLLREVGEALVTYARDARPKSKYDEVFLTAAAPFRPMTRISLNGVVSRIMQSSGINLTGRRFGPHSLRHSLASNMLRKGTAISTISSALGHESTQTTMEYLRIDVTNLRECVLDIPPVAEEFYEQGGGVFYD